MKTAEDQQEGSPQQGVQIEVQRRENLVTPSLISLTKSVRAVFGIGLPQASDRSAIPWIAEGKLAPVIGHVLPAEKAAEAYRLLLERKNFGKVVLKIAS